MIKRTASILFAGVMLALCLPVNAQSAPAKDVAPHAGKDSITHHSIVLDGKRIAYTAHAGTITIDDKDGAPTASMFYVAYTADGAPVKKRPVTFFWNGGPGGSSLPLHLGSFAPLRVAYPADGSQPRPDTPLAPNRYSLLDTSDLVFVDAIGTGWSRIIGKGKPTDFYSVDGDGRAFTQFIERWLTNENRWTSPKFLFGESYGTLRAPVVAADLLNDGAPVNGIVLQSSALDFNFVPVGQGPGEDWVYVSYLPTEAAVAWYHHKLPNGAHPNLQQFVNEVSTFAGGAYANALLQGDRLDAATRAQIVAKLHEYTGLSSDYIEQANLRIDPNHFGHALLLDKEEDMGRYDGRYVGGDIDVNGSYPAWDPSATNVLGALLGNFYNYARTQLGYRDDRPYIVLSDDINSAWKMQRDDNNSSAVSVVGDLKSSMTQDPYLHVFSANGYFDLATGFYGTHYLLTHMDLPQNLRGNVEFGYYPSGHMIYLNDAALAQYKRDLVRFYHDAVK